MAFYGTGLLFHFYRKVNTGLRYETHVITLSNNNVLVAPSCKIQLVVAEASGYP